MVKKLIATNTSETTKVENDVKKIDDIKKEVVDYAKKKIDTEVQNSVKKAEKKIIRGKNGKILRRDFLIIVLLCLCGFLGYKLYKTGFFDDYVQIEFKTKDKKKDEDKEEVKPIKDDDKEKPEDKEPEQEEEDLSFHSVALDNYYINSSSTYLKDYYAGNLTDELLLSMVLNKLDASAITEDEESYIITSEDLSSIFANLFEDRELNNKTFNYNGTKLKYLNSQNFYISLDKIDISDKSDINRFITNINCEDDMVTIDTIEAIIVDNKIQNVISKKVVGDYKDEKAITKYANKLNKLRYTFSYKDDNYKLVNIEKIK